MVKNCPVLCCKSLQSLTRICVLNRANFHYNRLMPAVTRASSMNIRIPLARTASRHHPADGTPPDDPADQSLIAAALAAPTPTTIYKRITDRSFFIKGKSPKITFRYEYNENIPDMGTAQKIIADFEAVSASQTTEINTNERNAWFCSGKILGLTH